MIIVWSNNEANIRFLQEMTRVVEKNLKRIIQIL